VANIYLVRHGRTPANEKGILAGRTPGIKLDIVGTAQAQKVADVLSNIKFSIVIVSPLQRCQETSTIILNRQKVKPNVLTSDGVNECDYGDWSNKKLSVLRRKPLWKTIQERPSIVEFPNGEKMVDMLDRFKFTIMDESKNLKSDENMLVISHGDPIRSFIADCLGLHLDQFQKISIDPCSISIVNFSEKDNRVITVNSRNQVEAPKKGRKKLAVRKSDLGGGAGH